MQTAMGSAAAAAFFLGGPGGAQSLQRGPSPGRPPAPCAVQLVPEPGGSSPADPPAAAPGRRARPFPQGREGGRARGRGAHTAGPGKGEGSGGRGRKDRSSAAIPRKAAGGREGERKSPRPPNRSPCGDPGGKGPARLPHPRSSPGTARLRQPARPQPSQRIAHQPPWPARAPRAAPARPNERTSPYHGAAAAGPAAAARTARPRAAAAAAASSRRGSECWGCEPAPPAIYVGPYPSAERPFPSSPARCAR